MRGELSVGMLSNTRNQIDTTGQKAGQTSEWPTNANTMQETVEWEDIVALRDLENFPITGECSTQGKGDQDMISTFAPPYTAVRLFRCSGNRKPCL
jgi:hypothetical protein